MNKTPGAGRENRASGREHVNYFKATEALLRNYRKLASLVADEDAYCEVEYHSGRRTFSPKPKAADYSEHKTEAEAVDELREERRQEYRRTRLGFEKLQRAISLFEHQREFIVVRLYYFGEDINGNPREGGRATWEEVVAELEAAGVLREIKTARRWRNKIVRDLSVCIFGIAAAVSAGTYSDRGLDK